MPAGLVEKSPGIAIEAGRELPSGICNSFDRAPPDIGRGDLAAAHRATD